MMSVPRSAIKIVVRLAPRDFYGSLRVQLKSVGVVQAVREHDTATIFNHIVSLLDLQGISDRAAVAYRSDHPPPTFETICALARIKPQCERLRAWEAFWCHFLKSAHTCSRPFDLPSCFLPTLDLRKGILAEAVLGFWLFIRDVCRSDFVGWIDQRLAEGDANARAADRAAAMQAALLEPLVRIRGTGPKIWSMIMADLLIAADPDRERWITTGASMVAVDRLVHAFLDRTGTLRRADAVHAYGPRCYEPDGCASIIREFAATVDTQQFEPNLPSYCPRWVQHAIWHYCAGSGLNVCNGNKIDDRERCAQLFCPAHDCCDRVALHPLDQSTRSWRP